MDFNQLNEDFKFYVVEWSLYEASCRLHESVSAMLGELPDRRDGKPDPDRMIYTYPKLDIAGVGGPMQWCEIHTAQGMKPEGLAIKAAELVIDLLATCSFEHISTGHEPRTASTMFEFLEMLHRKIESRHVVGNNLLRYIQVNCDKFNIPLEKAIGIIKSIFDNANGE
jgi:hypothetical protein